MSQRLLVSTAKGLEPLLLEELRELGLEPVLEPSGVLTFEGEWADAARVVVRSRIASRVLLSLRRFAATTAPMLYDQVRRVRWHELFRNDQSFVVEAHGDPGGAFARSFAPLKIKDGVVDTFRKQGIDRPNVDRGEPDIRLLAFFIRGRCELSIDLSGEPLHKRGYRLAGSEAPIRENRAAALLRFLDYDGSVPFVDPFCGSGTLPIEAALIARRIAPGVLRGVDSFTLGGMGAQAREALEAEWTSARGEGLERAPHPIRGSDLSPGALIAAGGNAERAGVASDVTFSQGDALELEAPGHVIAANPPYGERLEDVKVAADLVRAFADRVKHHAQGSEVGLVVPRGKIEKSVGLRPDARMAVESGDLKLRFIRFAIYAGSRKA